MPSARFWSHWREENPVALASPHGGRPSRLERRLERRAFLGDVRCICGGEETRDKGVSGYEGTREQERGYDNERLGRSRPELEPDSSGLEPDPGPFDAAVCRYPERADRRSGWDRYGRGQAEPRQTRFAGHLQGRFVAFGGRIEDHSERIDRPDKIYRLEFSCSGHVSSGYPRYPTRFGDSLAGADNYDRRSGEWHSPSGEQRLGPGRVLRECDNDGDGGFLRPDPVQPERGDTKPSRHGHRVRHCDYRHDRYHDPWGRDPDPDH